MVGTRPGYSTQDLWWELALMVEATNHDASQAVCGLVTDVRKCFNTLPRHVIYICARKCGFPEQFLQTWFSAINRIQRHFVISGACSQPLSAVTGFPEGDPLSVVAMAVLNLVLHKQLDHQGVRGLTVSYVDNWEAVTTSPQDVLHVWEAMQSFAHQVDIALDTQKTFLWSTDPGHRKTLRSGPLQVKLDARDLGGHMHYSRRNTMYTVRDRMVANAPLWGNIARSMAPVSQKLRLLPSVAWAKCFYGISIASIGQEHAVQLRAKVMQALRWNKKGANPMIQLSLIEHPRHDPGFHMVWDTFQAFRRRTDHSVTFAVLDELCDQPTHKAPPGPCRFLLERLHQLGWSWDGDGFVALHDGTCLDILHCPKQHLAHQAAPAWGLHVGSLWIGRENFQGLQHVDRCFSMQHRHKWSDEKAAILRTAINGTFFTRDRQFHSGKFESKQCQWRDADDSVFHRYWECPHFQDLRETFSREERQQLMDLPPCTYLHGWFTHTELDWQLAHCWDLLPTHAQTFEPVLPVNHDLHFFIDGGCHGPDCPGLKDDKLCAILKVRSHQDVNMYSDIVDQWALSGNNFVDNMTSRVMSQMPPLFHRVWTNKCREYWSRKRLRDNLHDFFYKVGDRAISDRSSVHAVQPLPVVEVGSVPGDDEVLRRPSLSPLPSTLPVSTRPRAIADHCDDMFQWLQMLRSGNSVCNRWMTSYQLFAHFQHTTGRLGYAYINRYYRVIQDPADGKYTFVLGSRNFVALLKYFASHVSIPCEVAFRFPAGCSFASWHRCISVPVCEETVRLIDSLFAAEGIKQVKNVGRSFSSISHFGQHG
eukprot:Skav235592  [mRNA]  locus=scaffold163:193976:196725:- [translate_table: standard]